MTGNNPTKYENFMSNVLLFKTMDKDGTEQRKQLRKCEYKPFIFFLSFNLDIIFKHFQGP